MKITGDFTVQKELMFGFQVTLQTVVHCLCEVSARSHHVHVGYLRGLWFSPTSQNTCPSVLHQMRLSQHLFYLSCLHPSGRTDLSECLLK